MTRRRIEPAVVAQTLRRMMESLLALSGLAGESMVRDPGWRFLDAGRRIERGCSWPPSCRAAVTVERRHRHRQPAPGVGADRGGEHHHLSSPLPVARPADTVVDLLALDADNPRSLAYQLEQLAVDVALMPALSGPRHLSGPERLVLEASTALRLAESTALATPAPDGARPELDAFLARVIELLCRTADAIDAERFVHLLPQQALL